MEGGVYGAVKASSTALKTKVFWFFSSENNRLSSFGVRALPDWLPPLLCAPFIGSFVGVLVDRVPRGEDFAWGRSACRSCGHVLGVADLVPVLSYVALRGRCRHCGAPIGVMHVWVELAAVAVAASAAAGGAGGALLWESCGLGWALLALGWIDALCQRLPDFLTLPLVLAGLGEALWLEPDALLSRLLGAVLGYCGFRVLAYCYLRLRAREGLGQGDAKLLAAGGAWVGLAALPELLLVAAMAGLVFALRKGRVEPDIRVAFGPFLAAGIWLLWLYG